MSNKNTFNLSKRQFFQRLSNKDKNNDVIHYQRLPWIDSNTFESICTRCENCISLCEENIIVKGDGGFPTIDFRIGECTFCEQCARNCPEPVFSLFNVPAFEKTAFSHKVMIHEECLARHNVECRSCSDVCNTQAISFLPVLGNVAQPTITLDACTGCGACVSSCPVSAISMNNQY